VDLVQTGRLPTADRARLHGDQPFEQLLDVMLVADVGRASALCDGIPRDLQGHHRLAQTLRTAEQR